MRVAVVAWGLCVLLAASARAQDERVERLAAWANTADAQKNRVLSEALAPSVQADLLEVLERGVRPCDCYTRRVRWAWALPVPNDRSHPAIVVSFIDPPREPKKLISYARFALIRFYEGRYVVTSALVLKRPSLAEKASLAVHMLPRRDLDGDGQLDIALHFAELWPEETYCGKASFESSREQLTLEQGGCDPTQGAAPRQASASAGLSPTSPEAVAAPAKP